MQTTNMRRLWWLLWAAVLALKTSYLIRYVELPFLYGPIFDSQVYLAQAAAVSAGRFGDPTLLAFSPLYGYFLALLAASPGLTVVIQLGLGTLNLVLIGRITARWFGEMAGLVSAALYLGYGVLLFYETKLMSETLGMSLLLSAVFGLGSSRFTSGERSVCISSGMLLGLATLARASLLPALPFFCVAPLLSRGAADRSHGRTVRQRAPRAAWLACGLGLVLLCYGAWTKLHSGVFVPVIMVANTAAQASRVTEWTGDFSVFASKDQEVSAWNVVNQARASLARASRRESEPWDGLAGLAGIDPLGYLRGAPMKAWLTVRDTETSFDYGYYGERSEIVPLRFAFISFGLLLGLAGVGLLLAYRAGAIAPLGSLVPIVLGVFLTTTLFHPSTRYRLPLVVALLPLAGYGVAAISSLTPARARWLVTALTIGLVCFFATRTLSYTLASPAMWELRVAEAAATASDRPEAERRLARAIELAPDDDGVLRRVAYVRAILGAPPRLRAH